MRFVILIAAAAAVAAALKLHVKDRFTRGPHRHTLCSTRAAFGIGFAVLCRHFIYDNSTGGHVSAGRLVRKGLAKVFRSARQRTI